MGRKVSGSLTAPACNISPVYQDARCGMGLQPHRRHNQPLLIPALVETRKLRRELKRLRMAKSKAMRSEHPCESSANWFRSTESRDVVDVKNTSTVHKNDTLGSTDGIDKHPHLLVRLTTLVLWTLSVCWTFISSITVHNTRSIVESLHRKVGNAAQYYLGCNTGDYPWS